MTDESTDQRGLDKLAGALAKAQASFPVIEKTRTAKIVMKGGGSYGYKYADLADILKAVRAPLADNGLSVVQLVNNASLDTVLMHTSGQSVVAHTILTCAAADPKISGSELTYRRRHALAAILGIATDDDTDGEGTEGSGTSDDQAAPRGPVKEPAAKKQVHAADSPAASEGEQKWLMNRAGDRLAQVLADVGCESIDRLTKAQFVDAKSQLMRAA